jgi:hypothetical protein
MFLERAAAAEIQAGFPLAYKDWQKKQFLLSSPQFGQNSIAPISPPSLSLSLSLSLSPSPSLFPQLPISQGSPAKERPITPITPRTSKKMFMDALLAPDTLTQEQLYDRDKAAELFTSGHADIGITVGIYMYMYWCMQINTRFHCVNASHAPRLLSCN